MDDIQNHSEMATIDYRTRGSLTIQSTYPRLSKAIIDEIDRVLARLYGLTDEELDIIKYRTGRAG